jgi:hypothetical protein
MRHQVTDLLCGVTPIVHCVLRGFLAAGLDAQLEATPLIYSVCCSIDIGRWCALRKEHELWRGRATLRMWIAFVDVAVILCGLDISLRDAGGFRCSIPH